MLESKRTFVAESLTGTAVWDPRFITGEGEKRMHDAPPHVSTPRAGHFLTARAVQFSCPLYTYTTMHC